MKSPDLPPLVVTASSVVERRLQGYNLRDVAVIQGGHSSSETRRAFARARIELANVPEVISNVEIVLDARALEALNAAKARRARRAAKLRTAPR